jgi:hypothetical protein
MSQKNEVLCKEGLDVDLWIVDREVDDDCIELSSEETRDQSRGAALGDEWSDFGVRLAQAREELRHEPSPRGSDDSEASFAGNDVVEGSDVRGDFAQFTQNSATVFENDRPLIGELTGRPVDEDCANLSFQARNVGRHVRLNGVQRPSSGGERSVVSYGDQSLDLPDIHL